jgi:hypothetical protein
VLYVVTHCLSLLSLLLSLLLSFLHYSSLLLSRISPPSFSLTLLRYATPYFASSEQPAVLISFVTMGNTFPVTEHHKANDSLLGYGRRKEG